MRAPVYRQLGQSSTLLGFQFPQEFGPLILLLYAAMALPLETWVAFLVWVALVGLYKLALRNKPEGFLKYRLTYLVRELRTGGFLSAAARAPQKRFPYGPYRVREPKPRSTP